MRLAVRGTLGCEQRLADDHGIPILGEPLAPMSVCRKSQLLYPAVGTWSWGTSLPTGEVLPAPSLAHRVPSMSYARRVRLCRLLYYEAIIIRTETVMSRVFGIA